MEETMKKKSQLPKSDSIRKLAEFWDTHDLTDFENELEEIADPVFVRGGAIKVQLENREAEAVQKMAKAKGVSAADLLRGWVQQKVRRQIKARPSKR